MCVRQVPTPGTGTLWRRDPTHSIAPFNLFTSINGTTYYLTAHFVGGFTMVSEDNISAVPYMRKIFNVYSEA